MKKRVKVYKAENGQGAYRSNLSKFLQKAQMGGQPTMEQMSYPGEQQPQEMDENQVINMIAMDITGGKPKEETMAKLTNIVGLDFQTADQFFESVREQLNSRKTEVEEESVEEESTPPDPSGNQEAVEKVEEEDEEEEGPSNNDIAYQDALEDDSDEAVMEGDIEGMYQMGGDVSEDFGDEYPVTLPDVSAYLPTDMYNFWDPTNPAAQVAWNQNMYANPVQQEVDSSYTEMPEEPQMARYGGDYKKVKKTYVNAILKANRRQMGGDSVSEESSVDATGQNYRTAKLKGFVGTLKNNATESLLREQAEQEFEQMMQMGGQEQDVENPMHHLEALSNATGNIFDEPMNQVTMAQRGGWLQRLRERNQQQIPNQGFMQRRGFMNPMMPIESIDVRKSGWLFGKPKEYSVTFGPPTLPGGANGAYPGAFYGYGAGYPMMPGTTQKKKVTTKGTIIDEAAKTVNQEASKEVAKTTPGSEATQKSAEGTKQTENTVTTNTGGGGNASTTTTTTTTNTTVKPVVKPKPVIPAVKTDKWGRPEGDKWYGFNPQTKKYEQGPNVKPLDFRGDNYTPGLSNVQQGVTSYVAPKSREEAIATNQQYFQNQRANWLQPQGMLVDVNANPIGRITQEDKQQAKQQVAVKKQADAVKKGDTSNLTETQIKALRLNYSQPGKKAALKKSNPNLYKTLFGQEEGGIIDFDQLQNMDYLQRFVYGGNEDPSLSYINQTDMDYSDSKDITDPYFQYGGVNEVTGIRNAQGQQLQNYVRPDGTYIKDITVNKTGMFGRPKQYSVTYSSPYDPRTPQFSLNTPTNNQSVGTSRVPNEDLINKPAATQSDRTDTTGLSGRAARQIRQGERRSERQVARGERRFGTAEEQAQAYERANPMETLPLRNAQSELNKILNRGPQRISTIDEIRNQVNMDYVPARAKYNYIFGEGETKPRYSNWFDQSGKVNDQTGTRWDAMDIEPGQEQYESRFDDILRDQNLKYINPEQASYYDVSNTYQNGGPFVGANPVVYTDNPALVGQSDVDMITLNPGIQGQGQTNWADLNNNRGFNLQQPTQYTVDPTQREDYQVAKTYNPGEVTIDVRNRLSNDQLQAGMNLANAGIRGITGFKNRMDDARIARDFYDNFTADNLYASDPSRDRGDYAESGLYRPDEQGQTWNSRSKQYGGDINFGEDPDYVEGDEVYMTDDEIRQYMANGGQVEYL
jgi:hypothetical protein